MRPTPRARLYAASALIALIAPLTACAGEEEPAAVKETANAPAAVVESEDVEGVVDEEPEEMATDEDEESQETAGLGDVVTVGAWDVKVTKVVLNANETIASANMFNDKPRGQYLLATYEATFNGTERTADAWSDLSWSFTTTDSQIHDESSAVAPADNEEWPTEARKGGTVRGQIVFDLKPNLIKGGLLTVEGYTDDYDTVYADFGI